MNRTTEINTIFKAFGFSILLLFFISMLGGILKNDTMGLKEPVKTAYSQPLEKIDFSGSENGIISTQNNNFQFYNNYLGFDEMKEVNDIDPDKPSYKISVPQNWNFLNGSMGSKINLDRLNRPKPILGMFSSNNY